VEPWLQLNNKLIGNFLVYIISLNPLAKPDLELTVYSRLCCV